MDERKIMRKRCFILASILFSQISIGFIALGTSRTFLRPRSAIEDVSLYLALNNYNIYGTFYNPNCAHDEKAQTIFIAAGIFGQQSTNGEQLGEYFLPNNKSSISIKEDGSGDVGSLWLELIAADSNLYSSTFTLRPERTIVGAYFNYHQNFCYDQRLWLDLKLATYEAMHKLKAQETVIVGPGIVPGVSNALDYLSSDEFNYGKISNCTSKVFGFDDIEIKLGYEFFTCNNAQLSLYASGLIPTANKFQSHEKQLFGAVVGRGHGALGVGSNTGINFWDCGHSSLTLMADFSYQYLFKRNEERSFDLANNGDWSRYLKVISNNTPPLEDMEIYMMRIEPTPNTMTNTRPAINYSTQSVGVTPGSIINLWAALHYQHCNWHVECGYNLWWKQSEKISFDQAASDPGVGIFNLNNTPPAQTYTYSTTLQTPGTASTANISQSRTLNGTSPYGPGFNGAGPNDVVTDMEEIPGTNGIMRPLFVPITLSNFNRESATQPSCLTNKLYLACSYDVDNCRVPFNVGLGGSFEFAHRNAVQQWGLWGNIQVLF